MSWVDDWYTSYNKLETTVKIMIREEKEDSLKQAVLYKALEELSIAHGYMLAATCAVT